MSNKDISEFWRWFLENEDKLRRSGPDSSSLTRELDRHVFNIDSRLNWELGEFENKFVLTISPNYNRDLIDLSTRVVKCAPMLDGWDFQCYRPRRAFSEEFELYVGDRHLLLNLNEWEFVFLQFPDGAVEIVLCSKSDLPLDLQLDSDESWILGSIILSGLLGEEVVTRYIDYWGVYRSVPEEFIGKTKKLIELERYFM